VENAAVALKDALECIEHKHVLGEYGPCTRPFVVLDIDEYNLLLDELKRATRRRRVPNESTRETNATV
jgi:hypothetical protein